MIASLIEIRFLPTATKQPRGLDWFTANLMTWNPRRCFQPKSSSPNHDPIKGCTLIDPNDVIISDQKGFEKWRHSSSSSTPDWDMNKFVPFQVMLGLATTTSTDAPAGMWHKLMPSKLLLYGLRALIFVMDLTEIFGQCQCVWRENS